MTLALGLIVKDEIEEFERIINDYGKYFDEIVAAVDKDIDKFKEFESDKIRIYPYDWKDDFADKRNFVDKKINSDYYFRLDMDDSIENPEIIRDITKDAKDNDIDIVYCWYVYSKDQFGNCNAAHYRETIIKKSDNLYWNKPVHENILPKSEDTHSITINKKIKINHHIGYEHGKESQKRNLRILEAEYKQNKEKTDPRTIAYLGRSYFTLGRFNEAVPLLEEHIKRSGWDEDRYLSWTQIAEIFKQRQKYNQAIGACFEALQEKPEYPDAYFKLHDIYFDMENWEKAIEFAEMGFKKGKPDTFMIVDPSSYGWRPTLSLSYCYFQKGEFEKAKKLFDMAAEKVPELSFVKQNRELYEKAVEHQRYKKHFLWLLKYIEDNDSKDKVENLIESVPEGLREDELIIQQRHKYLPSKDWSDNSIIIFCGTTNESWSPKTVESGIGGSEEAVIHMGTQLSKLGYDVTIFNKCGEDEGVYNGVEYINWYKFNPKDNYNILISWRNNIFRTNIEARQKIVWLHDMPLNLHKYKNCDFDKVIVLSEYHRSLLPDYIPEDKVYVSTNGIDKKDFKKLDLSDKEPHRMIWASSYDRGLELILKDWDKIKEEVPDAKLDCYYGWQVYDSFMKQGLRTQEDKDKLRRLMTQDGVHECGRIGHKELHREYAKSSYFAYPTNYAGEINAIALTKALATGLYCVSNDKYVLPERNPHKVASNENFVDELIKVLKENRKSKIDTDKYIEEHSWESVAKDWDSNLLSNKVGENLEKMGAIA